MTAATLRKIEIELTTESDPLFRYGQPVSLAQGQTGVVIGWEYISEETRERFDECDLPPVFGWHYSVRRDNPGLLSAIEIFSEAQLLQVVQG